MCTDCVNMYYGTDSNFTTPMTRCETACSLFSSLKYTKNYQCLDQCDSEKPVYTTGNICQFNCYSQPTEKFLNYCSNKCVSQCTHKSYHRNINGSLFCTIDECGSSNFTIKESYHTEYLRCESSCRFFANFTYTLGSMCVKSCPDSKKYYDAKLVCYTECPTLNAFADSSNQCVQRCDYGKYIKVKRTRIQE
ncbi:Tudor_domain [Hexamita inflata]|uniref:Tudor domain n=1 Tax=Hexamita inflata TaxID=28002 RepID=A0AA86UWW2_9EUKA|nr:Tudor domain [Hexamita inflata]